MKQAVVAVTGISGVGKTTFLKNAAMEMAFQHLTAGSLIAAARATSGGSREDLRRADVEENQRLLINGFAQARDSQVPLVVMDGHVLIDSGDGITLIPSHVFSDLEVDLIVHLEEDPIKFQGIGRAILTETDRCYLSTPCLRTSSTPSSMLEMRPMIWVSVFSE